METATQTIPVARWRFWTAAVLKVLLVAFLLMDSLMKVFRQRWKARRSSATQRA